MDTEQKATHTPEPWAVGEYGGIYPANGGAGIVTGCTKSGFLPNHTANERRIVACVNACANIPTGLLENSDGLHLTSRSVIEQNESMKQQHDELLAAAKDYMENSVSDIGRDGSRSHGKLIQAIAKAGAQ